MKIKENITVDLNKGELRFLVSQSITRCIIEITEIEKVIRNTTATEIPILDRMERLIEVLERAKTLLKAIY